MFLAKIKISVVLLQSQNEVHGLTFPVTLYVMRTYFVFLNTKEIKDARMCHKKFIVEIRA